MTILVPHGAEASAARRAGTGARIVAIRAGAHAADAVATLAPDEPVVVTGLCGGLGDVHAGEVAVYRDVADDAGMLGCDERLSAALERALPQARSVSGWTAARIVTSRAARAELAARSGAGVVDMEGTHLARALAARAIPFAMVRVVSDDASRDLPPLDDALGDDGRLRAGRVALAFVRRPRAALAFVRGVRRALAVQRAVVRAISPA